MIKPISYSQTNATPTTLYAPYFAGKSSTNMQNDFKGKKLNVNCSGFGPSSCGNKLNYFA